MNPVDWFRRGQGFDWPRILLVALLAAVVATIGVASAVSMAAFSPYGATWEGTSDFRSHMEDVDDRTLEILTSTSEYDGLEAADSTVFIFTPESIYTVDEIDHIQDYLDRGGTLVLLDSSAPNANTLLAGLGSEARLDGQILQDEHHYAAGPLMPIATEISNHSLVAVVEQVTLNHATAIEAGEATVLVSTSPFAYLGEVDDEIDDDTELASYPVATVESIGDGSLILVGDASVAIDAMFDEPDNRQFLDGLAGEASVVAIDTSKGPAVPPARLALLWLEANPWAQVVIGLGLIAAIAIAGERGLRWRRAESETATDIPRLTAEERRAYLADKHPEWDAERIDRIVGAFNHDDREADGDSDE